MYQSKFSSDISNTGRSMGHGIYTSDVVHFLTNRNRHKPSFLGMETQPLWWSSCCRLPWFTCLWHSQILVEQEDNYTWTYLGSEIDEPPLSLSIYIHIHSISIYIYYICTCICTMTQRCGNGWHLLNHVQHHQWRFTAWGFTTSYSIDICNCVHMYPLVN